MYVLKSPVPHICTFFTNVLSSGAFIIPFLVMLLVVGMPLLLLELALGQKLRVGAARAWYKVRNPNFPLPRSIKFDSGSPGPWWDWLRVNCGRRTRRLLLQRHHRLVHLLPLVLHECEWECLKQNQKQFQG